MSINVTRISIALLASTLATACLGADADERSVAFDASPEVAQELRISPMVQRLQGIPGRELPFAFELETRGIPTEVTVRAVSLHQLESGLVQPDVDGPAPAAIRLKSSPRIVLGERDRATIEGSIVLRRGTARSQSFGLLVRKEGTSDPRVSRRDNRGVQVGVRFVTQYLLRCDVAVLGARGDDMRQITIESAAAIEKNGRGVMQAWLSNPTESAFEFRVRGCIRKEHASPRTMHVDLHLPCRESTIGDSKTLVRLLPHSRVRVEEFVDKPIFAGRYEIDIELVADRRRMKKSTFPIAIGIGDFPAQQHAVCSLFPDVYITPSQVELSRGKHGKRMAAVTVHNDGPTPVDVEQIGLPMDCKWLNVRSSKMSIPPGGERKVLLSLKPSAAVESAAYVELPILAATAGASSSTTILVGRIGRQTDTPAITLSEPRLQTDGSSRRLVVAVENHGSSHAVLNSSLTLVHRQTRRRFKCAAGFGRWLLPGESTQLSFFGIEDVVAGDYEMTLLVSAMPNSEPLKRVRAVRFADRRTTTSVADDSQTPSANREIH